MKIRGHETFPLREGWIRKGVKNILEYPRLFTDKTINPCDILGIGTNMVKSLRYWLITIGVIEEVTENNQKNQRLTPLGELINQYDKYYEEDGTLWTIHYMLAKNKEIATSWYWFFNEFMLTSFNKIIFVDELRAYLKSNYDYTCSDKTLEDDCDCLLRTYYSKDKDISPENTIRCPLTELHLIDEDDKGDSQFKEYKKIIPNKDSLPPLVVHGVICEQAKSSEVLISDLMDKPCNIAKIFNMDRSTCFYYLEQLQKDGLISISRTAGLDVIKIINKMSFEDALRHYYINISRDVINE